MTFRHFGILELRIWNILKSFFVIMACSGYIVAREQIQELYIMIKALS